MINKTIYENGNGGTIKILNNDILTTDSLSTLVYLAMFGGNKEANTTTDTSRNNLRFDWWGNNQNDPSSTWINSETERTLLGVELSSQSRFKIEQAVKNDVKKLEIYGKITVNVSFHNNSNVRIEVEIKEPANDNSQRLIVIWDNTRKEIIYKGAL